MQMSQGKRMVLIMAALFVLAAVYLFQQFNFFQFLTNGLGLKSNFHPYATFVVNKTARLVLNDMACFVLIVAIFRERKYLRVAFYVFLFELLILLPAYLIIKLSLEGDSEISSPLLSQVHRMIVNPTLMILLMIGFFYQRVIEKRQRASK
jgi:exosortase F-associated protein